MYETGVSVIVYASIRCTDTPDSYIHYQWDTWLIHTLWLLHTLWLIHLMDTYTMINTPDWCIQYDWHNQSCVSVIVYVSIRCVSHSICINQVYQSKCMYESGVSVTLWLTHLIYTYTIADTPYSYIHYVWYIWLIHKLGVSVIVYVSIRCINQVYQS
jgi:hypothetical protein